jgi:hypothetical protein
MYTLVRFTQPFVFAGTVDMITYNFNASSNVEGYLDSSLADELINAGLAIDITPVPPGP